MFKKLFLSFVFCFLISQNLFAEDVKNKNRILDFASPDDEVSEISAVVLKEAYNRIGIRINIHKLPAERALHSSNSGKLDGEVNRIQGIDKDYNNLIMISVPVNFIDGVVFTKNLDFPVIDWSSLKPYSIAIRRGTKFAEHGTRGMNVTAFNENDKMFILLANDRYDVCVTSRIEGISIIQKLSLKGIKTIEPPLVKLFLYTYLHKKHEEIVPQITASLKELEDEGYIQKANKQYMENITSK